MTNKELFTIYLIRHGEANASWDKDRDPGLSTKGKSQSEILSKELFLKVPQDIRIFSSPLLRAKETAIPLLKKINSKLEINNSFREIPSPGLSLDKRKKWLKKLFDKRIDELKGPQLHWYNEIIETIKLIEEDTIVFTHFMVINCLVSFINKTQSFVTFYPDNCSVLEIEKSSDKIFIKEFGNELPTIVR